ncbi:MAG: carbon storage regulator CsrA [Thermodesulfobacteriota bacterium]
MLVITRKMDESITIGGNIRVAVLGIKGNTVKLGIDAPRQTPIYRTEVYQNIIAENLRAAELPQDLSFLDGHPGKKEGA